MKKIILYLAIIVIYASLANATPPSLPKYFDVDFSIIEQNYLEHTLKLEVRFKGIKDVCNGTTNVKLRPSGTMKVIGDTVRTFEIENNREYKFTVDLYKPDTLVGFFHLIILGEKSFGSGLAIIDYNDGSYQLADSYNPDTELKTNDHRKPTRNDFTEEELDQIYTVLVIVKPNQMEKALKILKSLPEPFKENSYKMDISLRTAYDLYEKGIKAKFANPPKWPRQKKARVIRKK